MDDSPSFSFTPEYPGVYTVRLTASDTDGAVTTASFTVPVRPTAVITGAPVAAISALTPVELSALGSSPLAPASSLFGEFARFRREYLWTTTPAVAEAYGHTSEKFPFVPTTAGQHQITLKVKDIFTDEFGV